MHRTYQIMYILHLGIAGAGVCALWSMVGEKPNWQLHRFIYILLHVETNVHRLLVLTTLQSPPTLIINAGFILWGRTACDPGLNKTRYCTNQHLSRNPISAELMIHLILTPPADLQRIMYHWSFDTKPSSFLEGSPKPHAEPIHQKVWEQKRCLFCSIRHPSRKGYVGFDCHFIIQLPISICVLQYRNSATNGHQISRWPLTEIIGFKVYQT